MVGEQGLILRWDGSSLTQVVTGTSATLYGVWGSSSSDVWIVGGTPNQGSAAPNDLVYHWDGQSLTSTDAPTPKGAAFFKVWGSAPGDLWVSGEGGTLWQRSAAGWTDYSTALATRDSIDDGGESSARPMSGRSRARGSITTTVKAGPPLPACRRSPAPTACRAARRPCSSSAMAA